MNPRISILICTRNRSNILAECLASFTRQDAPSEWFEVVIIDNGSTDETPALLEDYIARYSNFRKINEPRIGLSYARNAGYREAKADWVSYVDDDAKAADNYINRALSTIQNHSFDCIGGIFLPWYKYGHPKWLPKNFGTNVHLSGNGEVRELNKINACGGVIVFRKACLSQVGGFPIDLGMNGETIAYGEEDHVQNEMRASGAKIGLDPQLIIEHLVAAYKLDWRWHVRSAYAHGAAEVKVYQVNIPFPLLFLLLGSLVFPLIKLPFLSLKVLFDRGYYWQNLAIDIMGPAAHYKGRYDTYTQPKNQYSDHGSQVTSG
ncbi:MAG: glycosyltransferase [Saprospiraceae bacterium]|nr:glycosyltransferase [Saprospiraceae bacterium]